MPTSLLKRLKELPDDPGYNHLPVGHPDNPKHYPICGARTRKAAKGKYCLRQAGWGTAHVYEGRCRMHGGSSLSGPDHGRWKSGRYAGIWKSRLRKKLEPIQNDPNPLDMLPELEVSRVVLSLAMDRMLVNAGLDEGEKKGKNSAASGFDAGASRMVDGGGRSMNVKGYPVDIASGQFSQNQKSDRLIMVDPEDLRMVRDCTNDVINSAAKIIQARNQTALTKAETMYILAIMKEAITRFVPKNNQELFVKYLMDRVPVGVEEPKFIEEGDDLST